MVTTKAQFQLRLVKGKNSAVKVLGEPMSNLTIPLMEGIFIAGRHPASGILLDDPHVSANHAQIKIIKGVVTVIDMGSANGTSIDNARIKTPTRLLPGSVLKIEPFHFICESNSLQRAQQTIAQPPSPEKAPAANKTSSTKTKPESKAKPLTKAVPIPKVTSAASPKKPRSQRTEVQMIEPQMRLKEPKVSCWIWEGLSPKLWKIVVKTVETKGCIRYRLCLCQGKLVVGLSGLFGAIKEAHLAATSGFDILPLIAHPDFPRIWQILVQFRKKGLLLPVVKSQAKK